MKIGRGVSQKSRGKGREDRERASSQLLISRFVLFFWGGDHHRVNVYVLFFCFLFPSTRLGNVFLRYIYPQKKKKDQKKTKKANKTRREGQRGMDISHEWLLYAGDE